LGFIGVRGKKVLRTEQKNTYTEQPLRFILRPYSLLLPKVTKRGIILLGIKQYLLSMEGYHGAVGFGGHY
jgi:hypothetical protein